MDAKLASADKLALVETVKLAQQRGMKGDKGGWKEFLKSYDKKFGASLSDPARRSPDALAAFLKTFTKEDDIKFFDKVLRCHANRELVEAFMKKCSDNESVEQRLVRLTLEHPRYAFDYCFPSHEEEWIVTKLGQKHKALRSEEMVAVDCEMVLCEDGTEALVKVCVVDRNLQVKLNELVKPNKKVADYRTDITGIAAKDLEGISCSLADIQKSMKKILSHGTILIGHGLNNDLQALKIDHARVIDTSFIFKYEDQHINRRPSLNYLCKYILHYEVRKEGDPHNCVDDACAAMKLVIAKIERGFDQPLPLVNEDVPESEKAKLFLHRIPITVPTEELRKIISGDLKIEFQPIRKGSRQKYSVLAMFKNPEEASQAFDDVEGDLEMDSSGRPQKLISFQLSTGETASFYIRKMVKEDPMTKVSLKKRLSNQVNDSLGDSKKIKTDIELLKECQCENYVKEIEILNQRLTQKEDEISNLHKIISNLVRKQGL